MTAPTQPPPAPPLLRGHRDRGPNFMEQLQVAYIRAVAAAAGCNVGTFDFDDGVDVTLRHKHPLHSAYSDATARLDVQLKATHRPLGTNASSISTRMSEKRWNEYVVSNPHTDKIVVIMRMPKDPANWTKANQHALNVHYSAYWVNVAGLPAASVANPTVSAPLSQVFDDIALCQIMERIGKGQAP